MGVHGLWRLIEPSGKPVPVETLENKVLAVDVSIWLHQAVKGFQDPKGQPLPNAHLLGIYHRVCKLLYFRVKPVFVFDGGVPALKKETIAKRNQQKTKNFNAAGRIQKQLLNTLLKHSAVNKVLSEKAKASIEANIKNDATEEKSDDLFALPPQINSPSDTSDDSDYTNESTSETVSEESPTKYDIHSIDMESAHFRSLPADVRHEILTEVKETRKQSSWGRLHELPTQSDDFAVFQMNRLMKRYKVQVSIEEAEKEMGGHSLSLGELERLLNDQGVVTKNLEIGNRIASDENTRYLFIKDLKKAVEIAKQEQDAKENEQTENRNMTKADLEYENDMRKAIELSKQEEPLREIVPESKPTSSVNIENNKDTDEEDLQKAIQLSLECVPSSSSSSLPSAAKEQDSFLQELGDDDFLSDSSSESDHSEDVLAAAKHYMMEYSGLTPIEIAKILNKNNKAPIKHKVTTSNTSVKVDDQQSSAENKKVSKAKKVMVSLDKIPEESAFNVENQESETTIIPSESSDSSEEFEEVKDEYQAKSESALQIVINPMDKLEDDLFSDIFTEKVNKASEQSEDNTTDNIVSSTEDENKKQQHTKDVKVSPTKDRKQIIEEKETTISVIREMLKSVKGEASKACQSSTQKTEIAKVSVEELKDIQETLSEKTKELRAERSTKERMASNITDQMYQEAQELLELFGVPYVVAPMEAEAQCAFLDAIGLTDGTITDDSDIWLFGGKTVYKNFFNQSKHVLEFKAENIQHFFKLTREQMILLALLVGSDYTTGVQGIGPVTALEILAAFPSATKPTEFQLSHSQLLSGLAEFRKWYLGKETKGPSRTTLRKKLRNIVLSENFPSLNVLQAYLDPQVETSKEAFSWAKPDVVGLMDFARKKFGWTKVKSDEILKPVMKRLEERHTQTSIRDYFKTKHKIDSGEHEKYMSKRVKKALDKIGKGCDEEDTDQKKEKKIIKRSTGGEKTEKSATTTKRVNKKKVEGRTGDEELKVLKQTKRRSRRRAMEIEEAAKLELNKEEEARKRRIAPKLHVKEYIHQKEKDKKDVLRSKLKAIEVFRKSKQGPGYVKKRQKVIIQPKDDAELSESSSSD